MSLIEFIFFHVFAAFNLILIASLPLLYFYVIPATLQQYLDAPVTTSTRPIKISRLSIGPLGQDGFNVDMGVGLNPFTHFPIYAGFGDLNVRVVHQNNDLLMLHTTGISLWMNQPNVINPSLNLTWNHGQQENMQNFIGEFSDDTLQEKKVVLYFCPEVKLYSMTLYQSLCLHYSTQIDYIKPRLEALEADESKTASSFVFDVPDTKSAQDALTANFGSDELSSLSSNFKFMWKKLFVKSDDKTVSFEFVAEFVNPTVFELALIEKVDFFIELMGTKIVMLSLVKLGLSAALNDAFDMRIDLTFIGDSLDYHNTQLAIEQASKSYSETNDFEFAIVGPFNIAKAGFAASITEKFKYSASFKDTMTYLYSHSDNADSSTIKSLIDHSHISASLLSDHLDAFLVIDYPFLSSLKPPLNYSFPFFFGFDLYGGDLQQRVMKTIISPIVLQKEHKGFKIQTNATIYPENTLEAASSLAAALNPLLSRTPKDFSLSMDGKTPYLWCKNLFGERVLAFGLPPLNKNSWSSTISNTSGSFGASLDGILDISQLKGEPGFQASGNVKVKYPSSLPELKINLGYLRAEATVESVSFSFLELPKGISYVPGLASTNINANVVLSRSSDLSSKIQKLADYLISSSAVPPVIVGVTGVLFGSSRSSNIVTFSQIVYEFDPLDYISPYNTKSANLLAPGSLKLEGIDLRVQSASDVSVTVASILKNPFPCNIGIGKLSFDVLLDDKSFLSVSIPPLQIQSGTSILNASINLRSDQYNDELLAEKVGKAYIAVFGGGQEVVVAGLTRIEIASTSSIPGSKIDQFRDIKFTSKLSSSGTSVGSAVDYSSVMHANSNLPLVSSVQMLQFKAKAHRNVLAGSDFAYSNPYPVSVDIPFLSLSSQLNHISLVDLQLSSLVVGLGDGNTKPRAQLIFQNQPELPDAFSKFYSSLESGRENIVDRLLISSFCFGSNEQDRNVLLSKIPFDATTNLLKFFKKGDESIASSSLTSLFGNNFSASLDYANIRVFPADVVSFDAGSIMKSPIVLDIDVPYLNIQAKIDGVQVGSLKTSLVSNTNTGKLVGEIRFDESDQLSDHFGALYRSYQESNLTSIYLQGGALSLGTSQEDAIDFLSKTNIGYTIKDLTGTPSTPSSSSLSIPSFKFTNTSVSVQPARSLIVDSLVTFNNSYKITVSGLGFVSSSVGIDGVSVMMLSSRGFDVGHGSNSFNPTIKSVFPSSLSIQDKVASFGDNLWNHYGETNEKIFVTGFLFGVSEQDYIKAFSKLDVSFDSSKIFKKTDDKPQKRDVSKSVFSLSQLDIKFNPSTVVNLAIQGALNLTYQLSVSFPYLSFGGDIESNHLFDVGLNGLSLSGGNNLLNVTSEVTLQDNDALSTIIATLYTEYDSGAKLSGSAGAGYLKFGVDSKSENVIDTFAKLRLNLGLESLLSGSASSTNNSSMIKDIHFGTNDIQVKVLPDRNIQAIFVVLFNCTYPISIQGLGLVSSHFAIDKVPSLKLEINGLDFSRGSNRLNLDSNLIFESGNAVSSSFAALYDQYQNRVPISARLLATKTVFGFNAEHQFSLLSKCTFNGSWSFLALSNSSSGPLFSEYLLQKLHLGTLPSGEISLAVGATLKNSSVVVGSGQVNYFQVNSWIDDQQLGKLSLSGLNATSEKKDLMVAFSSFFHFNQDEGTQDLLAHIFDNYWKKIPVVNEVTFTGLLLGADDNIANVIDAFSKIKIRKPLSVFLLSNDDNRKPSIFPAGFTYNITYVDLDLFDNSTLTSKLIASFDLGPEFRKKDFKAFIPFISGSVLYNQSDFVTLTMHDLGVQESDVSVTLLLKSHGNKPAWNTLIYTGGLLEAERYVPIPDTLQFHAISFGSASDSSIKTFSKMTVLEPIDNLATRFSGVSNTTTVLQLRVELHPQGLLAEVYTALDFPYFHSKVDVEFESHFQAKQVGPAYPYATYKITDFSLPNTKLVVYPILQNNSASVALKNYISVFSTDYLAQDSRYGFATLTSKSGLVFRDLDQAYLYGTKGSDWAPYVVDIVPPNDWKWDIEHAGYLNGPFNLKGKFHNFGITHFDIGDAYVHVNVRGKPLCTIETVKALVILNYKEGAATLEQSKFPVMGEIGIFWPKEFYGELWFTHVLRALNDARQNPSHLSFEYGFKRNGALIPYMNQVLDNMPAKASTNSSFSICDLFSVMRLEIFNKPDWQYPLLVPFEHSINSLFLHCDFTSPSQPIPLQNFIQKTKVLNSMKNNSDLARFPTLSDISL